MTDVSIERGAPPAGRPGEQALDRDLRPLWSGFLASVERFGDRPALLVEGQALTYAQLGRRALQLAATLQVRRDPSGPALTAVFAYRSQTAFAGVLGTLLSGHGYVPLNRTFPASRSRVMLQQAGCRSMIVDRESAAELDALLEDAEQTPMLILLPDCPPDEVQAIRRRFPAHAVLGEDDLQSAGDWQEPESDPEAVAYLLFTSGSTGIPKGVMVAHRNVRAFLDYVVERYQVTERDRLSQMFDMTFDLSVFDMFVAWERGAWLCCPPQKALMNPASFIRDNALTVWFSVPSTAVFMKRLGSLKPDAFPSLRLSLFCGEPLPTSSALAWAQAAPHSVVENIYGPTELTIACTHYRWEGDPSLDDAELGVVAIGQPFAGMRYLVVDETLEEVPPGGDGELLMTGPQMTLGYWNDPAKTAAAFVVPPGAAEVYYRTGDRVRRPAGSAPLTHLGRMDSQIKIRGHRVELGEIEATVRVACGHDGVVALPWPVTASGPQAVEVFIQGEPMSVDELRGRVAATLPDYMVPRRFHFCESLPLNVNGKFDRKALAQRLKEG